MEMIFHSYIEWSEMDLYRETTRCLRLNSGVGKNAHIFVEQALPALKCDTYEHNSIWTQTAEFPN